MSPMPGMLLLVISIAALSSIDSAPSISVQCKTDSECSSDTCCLLGPLKYAMPMCMPFQQKGEQCRVNPDVINANLSYPNFQIEVNDIHFILCPCADGLSCNPTNGTCEKFSVN